VALGTVPSEVPSVVVLLEYLSNMVYALELMLKLLSDDWGSHDFAGMYQHVYGSDHTDPALMQYLQEAVKDQKYLFEPSRSLGGYIKEIEELYDALWEKIRAQHARYEVAKTVKLPMSFAKYLRDNLERFYEAPSILFSPSGDHAKRVQQVREQGEQLL